MTGLSMPALTARVDRGEVLRYLGAAGAPQGDAALSALVEQALDSLEKTAVPRMVWRRVAVTPCADGVGLGPLVAPGADLRRHLAGCREAVLFAATLGIEVDGLIRRAGLLSMSQSAALQAGAAALLETYCDWCQEELAREPGAAWQRSRFSPGYGDLPLSFQGPLLQCLESRRIGLSVTAAMMMVPTKSVSAVIGLGDGPAEKASCRGGCAHCTKTDCPYRKAQRPAIFHLRRVSDGKELHQSEQVFEPGAPPPSRACRHPAGPGRGLGPGDAAAGRHGGRRASPDPGRAFPAGGRR